MTASQARAAWPSTSSSRGKTPRQRVRFAVVAEGIPGQRDRGVDGVDLHAGCGRAQPRVGDVGADLAAVGLGVRVDGRGPIVPILRRLSTAVRRIPQHLFGPGLDRRGGQAAVSGAP
jgi:hypothetical protein